MRSLCALHHDADFVARALSGELASCDASDFFDHARGCPACTHKLSLLAAARDSWEQAKRFDQRTSRAPRERRLLSASSVQRTQRRAAVRAAAMVAVVAAATLAVVVQRQARPAGELAGVASTCNSVEPAPVVSMQSPPSAAPVGKGAAPEARVSVIATRGQTRASGASLEAGASIARDDLVTVQIGATLLLAWSLADEDRAESAQVDVAGPARIKMSDERGTSVLVLDSGTARVTSSGPRVVRTAQAVLSAEKGEWLVAARPGATYVDARAAKVAVDALSGGKAVVEAGGDLWVRDGTSGAPAAAGSIPDHRASAPRETSLAAEWRAAQDAITRGDTSSAESSLAAVVARSTDAALRARAQLRLGEVLLARGAIDEGRAKLAPLFSSRDPSLGADAAFLYASSFRDPAARAGAWALYLASHPPSPQYEDALLQQAFAKLDIGDVQGARRISDELRLRSLSPLTVDGLRVLDRRLPPKTRPAVDGGNASPLN